MAIRRHVGLTISRRKNFFWDYAKQKFEVKKLNKNWRVVCYKRHAIYFQKKPLSLIEVTL